MVHSQEHTLIDILLGIVLIAGGCSATPGEENVTPLMASYDSLVDGYVDEILHLKGGQIT